MIYILAAMLCLLVVATAFSRAGRLDSIRALSGGLHLFVRRGGSRTELVKIAQPRMASVSGEPWGQHVEH